MSDLTGKIALVTGANRGIGAEIAYELGRRGATVAVNYRGDDSGARAVLARLAAQGAAGESDAFKGDVADSASCTALIEAVVARYGRLDVVVNNAGITRDNVVMMMDAGDFDAVIGTHLRGTFLVSKAAARRMFRLGSRHTRPSCTNSTTSPGPMR